MPAIMVRRLVLGLGAGLLVAGVGVGLTKLDLERFESSSDRMRELAEAVLPLRDSEPQASGDWSQWRGPDRDGLCREAIELRTTWPPEGPPVLWRKVLGRGFSSMAVVGGRLYTMAQVDGPLPRETVVCWNAVTGVEVWRFGYRNQYDHRFGSGPRSTPAVADGLVYTVGPTGIFHCLRADTGEKVWRHDLADEFHSAPLHYGVSFSPLCEGDLVYVMPGGPNGNAVAAFDRRTGKLVWKALDDPIGYSSPIAVTAAGVRQILFFTNSALVSLSPEEGRLNWRFPWKTEGGFNIATPLPIGDYVFISSAYGKGCALLEISGEAGALAARRVYEHNRMRNHFASSVRYQDHIYGFDGTDVACMDVRTGRIAWRERGLSRFGKGTLLIAQGNLFILGESGKLFVAEATPAGYHELGSFQVVSQHKCWTVPVLSGGRLYVRDEADITCLDLRKR